LTYRTANLQSCILYIYSTNIGTEYFKHGLHSPSFFSSKCSLFHNSKVFGSCIIHILYTGVLKLKNNYGAKRLIFWYLISFLLRRVYNLFDTEILIFCPNENMLLNRWICVPHYVTVLGNKQITQWHERISYTRSTDMFKESISSKPLTYGTVTSYAVAPPLFFKLTSWFPGYRTNSL